MTIALGTETYCEMQLDHVHIIINPASGKEEPILSYLNAVFRNCPFKWSVSITQKAGDATQFAKEWAGKTTAIAVYGGDGTVTEVARGLQGSRTPMAILAGGTANVVAKELGLAIDTQKAIELLAGDGWTVKPMDAATANGELFLIRLNFGIMAEMILDAGQDLKAKFGQVAYGLTAAKSVVQSPRKQYRLTIDGTECVQDAVALTITNCGSIGIADYSFLPSISSHDGKLDIIALTEADLVSMIRVAGSTLLQSDSKVLRHWTGQTIEMLFPDEQRFLLDDIERKASSILIKTLPGAIGVIVPYEYA